jgi:hypothetical protein
MQGLNRYLRPQARHTVLLWSVAGIVLGVSIWTGFIAFEQHAIVEQVTTRNNKLLVLQASSIVPASSHGEQENAKRWAQLKLERDFPWASVFLAVEKAASPDIELLQFKPDKLNRQITLGGEVRNHKALVAYLDGLSKQAILKNVYLVHEQSVQRDTLETIAFEIRATLVE